MGISIGGYIFKGIIIVDNHWCNCHSIIVVFGCCIIIFSSTAMGDCTAGAGKGNCAANSFPTASRATAICYCRYSVLVRLAMKCCVSFCNYGKYELAEAVVVVSVLDLVSR